MIVSIYARKSTEQTGVAGSGNRLQTLLAGFAGIQSSAGVTLVVDAILRAAETDPKR